MAKILKSRGTLLSQTLNVREYKCLNFFDFRTFGRDMAILWFLALLSLRKNNNLVIFRQMAENQKN